MPNFKHRYSIRECPECKADLTKPGSVLIEFRVTGDSGNQETHSHLDANGLLVDVDEVIANGYHVGTSCAACCEPLDEHEVF